MKRILRKILGSKVIRYDYKIVHLYADKENKLTLIPTGESKKWRLTTDLNIHIEIVPPYSETYLEEKLFEAMKMCFSSEPDDVSYETNAERANATKEYNKKVKGKRLITLFWNKDDGYVVEPYKKAKGRGFNVIDEKVIRIGTLIEEGTLAEAIREAMEMSEPY